MDGIQTDEKPFINAKINEALIDFDQYVDYQTRYRHWKAYSARGKVGDQPVSRSQTASMLWETGHAIKEPLLIQRCSYDGKECYEARTLPVVFDLSQRQGYLTGGQNLTLHGHGFNFGKVSVSVDGVDCAVTSKEQWAVSCKVGGRKAISDLKTKKYFGSNGLRVTRYRGRNSDDVHNYMREDKQKYFKDSNRKSERLALEFETHFNTGSYFANVFKGWFTAPATANYMFRQACDDYCSLKLAKKPDSILKEDIEEILNVNKASYNRWYHSGAYDKQVRISKPKPLVKG